MGKVKNESEDMKPRNDASSDCGIRNPTKFQYNKKDKTEKPIFRKTHQI